MESISRKKYVYGIFSTKTNRLVLIQGELPIYWSKKVAEERNTGFLNTCIKKVEFSKLNDLFPCK